MKGWKRNKIIRKKRLQTRHDRIMTLANAISISRIFLAIPLVILFEGMSLGDKNKVLTSFFLILVIVLTDFLDGFVARKTDEITNFGKLIDPVADKICMMVVAIYLIITYKLPFIIFFITMAIRDTGLIIVGVYLILSEGEVFQSNTSGKWCIGIVTLMMTLFVYNDLLNLSIWVLWSTYIISSILFIISTYEYISRYIKVFNKLENV